ncbi:MAG: response regulator [Phycisphaerae bacterium]|jgi:CheY-like chemotaxis protein
MVRTCGFVRRASLVAALAWSVAVAATASALVPTDDFITGRATAAWAKWQPAMQAILDRQADQAEELFGELLAEEPAAFRIALLAERTINRTALGGAVLLLEQDAENQALGPNGQRIAELLEQGREQMNEADDGWYFCAIGRFDVAQANFQALLGSDPDPVALLEFTDRVPQRREMLLRLTDNIVVGESVRAVLKLLDVGEEQIKADPTRIKENIVRLGGSPRANENGVAWLKQSGEYAIPFMVEFLRDPAQQPLTRPILACLPQIDRPALNPLLIALRMDNVVVKNYLIDAAGKIGYPQALPYLLQQRDEPNAAVETREAVETALGGLQSRSREVNTSLSAADAFYQLAEAYYADLASLAADPRLDTANVWYWTNELLQNTEVPVGIFNEIMCMRCCEEALRLEPSMKKAQALWVAANFRREVQLGEDQVDPTRPENYPSAGYFAQTGGPDVCLMALARALDDGDPAVALGTIEALAKTAGPASITGDASGRLPLAEALSFPDRMVRIRAALTLGNARPVSPFLNQQNLMPVLSEALMLYGGARNALVVDPDTANANAVAGILSGDGYEVAIDGEFLRGLQKVREMFPSLDVIFLAADISDVTLPEALAQLRAEFRFGATPVIIINKPGQRGLVRDLVRADHRLGDIVPGDAADRIRAAVETVSRAVGVHAITPEAGTALAMEAAETLDMLAVTHNPLFAVADAKLALIAAMGTTDPALRIKVAHVLGYLPDTAAQEAIAIIALDENQPEDMRVAMFTALAQAAKACGNQLESATVDRLVSIAEKDANLVIRTAASETLGALNLAADKGSEIIRNQYGG